MTNNSKGKSPRLIDYDAICRRGEALPWCVFVTTGQTGSDFFQSLLDSHPEVILFNGQIQFDHFWEDVAHSTKVDGARDITDITYEFIAYIIRRLRSRYDTFERKDMLGENKDQSFDLDLDEYRRHLVGILKGRDLTRAAFLRAAYIAFSLCVDEDFSKKKIFFHHLHQVKRLPHFLADVPDAKVLFMTRDPRAIFVSGVEHWRQHNPDADTPAFPLQIMHRTHTDMEKLTALGDIDIRALRLEDLGTETIVQKVCAWLGVSYGPTMKESTWGGLRWWGDKISSNHATNEEKGFSPSVIKNNWQRKLSFLDIAIFDRPMGPVMVAYGYDHVQRTSSFADGVTWLAIWIPGTYERKHLTPLYLFSKLARGQIKDVLRAFYHPLRRVRFQHHVLKQVRRQELKFPELFVDAK
jgi:hypothetical protein